MVSIVKRLIPIGANSYGIIIPEEILLYLGIEKGDLIKLEIEEEEK